MGMSTHVLSILNGFHHLFLRLTQTDDEMDSNEKLSKSPDGHSHPVPIVFPTMGTCNPFSSQSIKEFGSGSINRDSYPVCPGPFHRFKRAFILYQRRRDEGAHVEIRFLFEPFNNIKSVFQ